MTMGSNPLARALKATEQKINDALAEFEQKTQRRVIGIDIRKTDITDLSSMMPIKYKEARIMIADPEGRELWRAN